jgi:hypothetical protein
MIPPLLTAVLSFLASLFGAISSAVRLYQTLRDKNSPADDPVDRARPSSQVHNEKEPSPITDEGSAS